jgi:hypothetical protein
MIIRYHAFNATLKSKIKAIENHTTAIQKKKIHWTLCLAPLAEMLITSEK